jgi:hypothetical protein
MTGAINPLNVIQGPVSAWYGAFAVTEPAQTNAALIADPGAGWSFAGSTQGGLSWEIDHTTTNITVDQSIDPITTRVTGRSGMVTFNAAEPTLALLALALNNFGTTTVLTGLTTYTPGQPTAASPVTCNALLLDGWAPLLGSGLAARRRAIFRKMANNGKMVQSGDPTKNTVWALQLEMYFVSASIDPYIVMDQTA